MKSLKEKISQLPETAGVYFMKNAQGTVIYVGKAKNLKRRVASYFVNNKQHSKKVLAMVPQITDFKVTLTETEFDALVLECQQIHLLRPQYNSLMNHYEAYGFFQFLDQSPYLKILDTWSDQGFVLGPFYKKSRMQELKEIIGSVYRLEGPLKFATGIAADLNQYTPEAEFSLRLLEIRQTFLGEANFLLNRIDEKVQASNQRQDYEAAQLWWQRYLLVERFLRRNKQLFQTMQKRSFVGILAEDRKYYCYLYVRGEMIATTTYQRKPSFQQAKNKLAKKVSQAQWQLLAEKKYLAKADVDLFLLFFNYLNRQGEIQSFHEINL